MIVRLAPFAAIMLIVVYPQTGYCWEATYDQHVTQTLESLRKPKPELKLLEEQKVEYPTSKGSQLGQGWDMLLNKKVNSTCIDFKPQQDKSETVVETLHEATDQETRDVTLNTTFTIGGGGSFAGFGGSGSSSQTKNIFATTIARMSC